MNLWKRNFYKNISDLTNHCSGSPTPSFWSKWFGGVIVPACILIYALRCCILQKAILFGSRGQNVELSGMPAIFMGLVWLSGAFFLHFHFFWSSHTRLYVFSDLGKFISLTCLVGTFGYVVWSIIM